MVKIENGSQITAETLGTGNGGIIQIETNNFTLSDRSIISTSTKNSGDAGTILVDGNSLIINSQGKITTSSIGLGQAGSINLNSGLIITDRGLITATSEQTGGGDIEITTDFLQLQNNSLVSTSVLDSNGGGGNINISSNTIISNNNSDIRANAIFGSGGNINISTEVIFTSLDSDIDASSKFGLNGEVTVTRLETDRPIDLIELPDNVEDPTELITATCPIQTNNVMVISGKGGLPDNPGFSIRGQSVWQDLRLINPQSIASSDSYSSATNTSSSNNSSTAITPIVEAKGWMVNANGKVELLTHSPDRSRQDSWYRVFSCQDLPAK